jgi:hypothetical protein
MIEIKFKLHGKPEMDAISDFADVWATVAGHNPAELSTWELLDVKPYRNGSYLVTVAASPL